jgi:hypothetical protein
MEVNSPGLKHESRESSSGTSTTSSWTHQVTLQNWPMLTCSLKDETLYKEEPINQHLPHQALVGTWNPGNTLVMTPVVHPSPAHRHVHAKVKLGIMISSAFASWRIWVSLS